MAWLEPLAAAARVRLTDWWASPLASLHFGHLDAAKLAVLLLAGFSVFGLAVRMASRGVRSRQRLALPVLLGWMSGSWVSSVRHGALLIFLVGLGFFALALADPYTKIIRQDVSYPGRRIGLLLDASSSMMAPFSATTLKGKGMAFSTNVAAAEYFMRLRMKGKYRDLIGLVEFGDEAYVITPFTNDYDNILLSVSLIGDVDEFRSFPDKGTVIARAIEQGVNLFRAFDFLKSAGNVMVIFSDGQDTQVAVHGRSVYDILDGALKAQIPVYFIRTEYNKQEGALVPDQIWKPAVERTGGKFYAGSNENSLLDAIHDIDRLSAGKIEMKEYSVQRTRFSAYANVAFGLWTLALALRFTLPWFRRFP